MTRTAQPARPAQSLRLRSAGFIDIRHVGYHSRVDRSWQSCVPGEARLFVEAFTAEIAKSAEKAQIPASETGQAYLDEVMRVEFSDW